MPRLFIVCPNTEKAGDTGLDMDLFDLDAYDLGEQSMVCPRCHEIHTSTKDDVRPRSAGEVEQANARRMGTSASQSDTSLYILGVCRTLTAIVIRWVGSRVIASLAQVTPSIGSVTDTTSHSGPRPPK